MTNYKVDITINQYSDSNNVEYNRIWNWEKIKERTLSLLEGNGVEAVTIRLEKIKEK